MPMNNSLCASCSGFIASFGDVEDDGWYSCLQVAPNINSLRSQARTGCHLCQTIYHLCCYGSAISQDDQYESIEMTAYPVSVLEDTEGKDMGREDGLLFRDLHPRELGLSISCGGNDPGSCYTMPLSVNYNGRKEGGMSLSHPHRVISDPRSPEGLQRVIQLAKRWLFSCRSGHVGCSNSEYNGNCPPTRLIDVGLQEGERMARLHIPDRDARGIEYAALSYAWGNHANFAKTTASNLDNMKRLLPWERLSKTIQDAIVITRGLGIRYLWVDALCVLQKEKINGIQHMEDWSIEAARFASYYQNAVLTIAATGSDSSSKGLFLERPGLEFNPEPIIIRQKSVWTGFRDSTIPQLYPKPQSELEHSALRRRGWTTQERLLSERILHFSANCIFWECFSGYMHEVEPDLLDTEQRTSEFHKFKDIHIFNNEKLINTWYHFVYNYSLSEFSVESDRLPALSGVASLVSNRCQQKYIAGIWESSVAEGLTWVGTYTYSIHTDDPIIHKQCDETHSQTSDRVTPSWSWASSNGQVYFEFFGGSWKSMIQVKDFQSRSKGSETSGQVLEARLTIKGLFRMIDLSQFELRHTRNQQVRITSAENNDEDIRKLVVFMDGVRPANPISTQPRLCLLLGTIDDQYCATRPWQRVKMGIGCLLEHCGRRYAGLEGYKRIGLVNLPFDEYWSDVKDSRTIELV